MAMHPRAHRFLAPFALGALIAAAPLSADPPSPPPVAPATVSDRDTRPLGPASSPQLTSLSHPASVSGPGTLRTAVSLAAVLALIIGGAALFRRFAAKHPSLAGSIGAGGKSPAGILEVVGRYPIARGSTLVLLRLDTRILLLSQTAGAAGRGLLRSGAASLSTLCEISAPNDVASILAKARDAEGDSMTARFQSLLSGLGAGQEPHADDTPPSTSPDTDDDRPAVVVRAGSWAATGGGHS
jgi:hypothetical protein